MWVWDASVLGICLCLQRIVYFRPYVAALAGVGAPRLVWIWLRMLGRLLHRDVCPGLGCGCGCGVPVFAAGFCHCSTMHDWH